MQTDDDPIAVYPVQNDGVHAIQRMALACAQLYRRIEQTAKGELPFVQKE
jgi:hypothetical protein